MNRRSALAAATSLAFARTHAFANPASAIDAARLSPLPDLATLLRTRLAHQGVGLAAARVDAQGLQLAYAGARQAGSSAAVDAGTHFEYGSVTKTFIGLLLAQMALARELALDEPVQEALGLPLRDVRRQPITWADLATHRSGLPRLPDNLRHRGNPDPYAAYTASDLEAFLRDWKADVPRDTRWVYSNLGFGLLGHALARRARQPLDALLRTRVLAPLQIEDAQLARPGVRIAALAMGHDAARSPVSPWTFDALAGAGALAGTAAALARHLQAAAGLVANPLDEAFTLALTPRAEGPNSATRMGLGWMLAPLRGRTVATHDGGTAGFVASVFVDRPQRRASLVLGNQAAPVTDLALHVLEPAVPPRDLAAEAASTQRTAANVSEATLKALAGRYALNPQFAVTVRQDGTRLFARATGQGEFELFALDARRWFARVTPLEIHFEGESGPPPAFVLHQGGQRLRFVRE